MLLGVCLDLVAELVEHQAQRVNVLAFVDFDVQVFRRKGASKVVFLDFRSHVGHCADYG